MLYGYPPTGKEPTHNRICTIQLDISDDAADLDGSIGLGHATDAHRIISSLTKPDVPTGSNISLTTITCVLGSVAWLTIWSLACSNGARRTIATALRGRAPP